MVAFISMFIQWLSDDNLCRVFQVVISCYRMLCTRRCARDEKSPLYKHRRPHLESTTILQQMIALMECQTRQEAVWVSVIKLLSLLSLSLFSTLLLGNVDKNVHHTLLITCLKWINFFFIPEFPSLSGWGWGVGRWGVVSIGNTKKCDLQQEGL